MLSDLAAAYAVPLYDWRDPLPPTGEPRVPFRFRLVGADGWPVPESVALVDAAVLVLDALRRGETPSELVRRRFTKAFLASAYRGRQRQRSYTTAVSSYGEAERLEATAVGALRVAAVLIELREVRFRD